MRTLSAVIAAVALIIICSTAHASAVLVDATGDVTVKLPDKGAAQAVLGLELANGSVVTAGQGASASILSENGSLDQVAEGQSYTVGQAAAASASTSLGSGIAIAMREMAQQGEGPSVHGMVKKVGGASGVKIDLSAIGGAGQNGIYPCGTSVKMGPNIEFMWGEPIAKEWKNPSVIVENKSGDRLCRRPLSAGSTSLAILPRKIGMARGREYRWYLADEREGAMRSRTPAYRFTTLSDAEEKGLAREIEKVNALKLSPDAASLLVGQVYFGHGMYDDMVRKLAPLYDRVKSPFVRKLLHSGYMRMGRSADAKKYE